MMEIVNRTLTAGQGLDNVNIQLLRFLCSFVWNLFGQHQLGRLWLCPGEWVWQGEASHDVTAIRTRNRTASVLRAIIGVPCNVLLPRGSAPSPTGSSKWEESGLNGSPVRFKQTQGDPLLSNTPHRLAGSLRTVARVFLLTATKSKLINVVHSAGRGTMRSTTLCSARPRCRYGGFQTNHQKIELHWIEIR